MMLTARNVVLDTRLNYDSFFRNFTNPRANLRKGNLVATEVGDPDTFLFNTDRND